MMYLLNLLTMGWSDSTNGIASVCRYQPRDMNEFNESTRLCIGSR